MKKKTAAIVTVILAVLIAAGVYVGLRIYRHGTDIIGVTTLTGKNRVIMNSATGNEFESGNGRITIGEGGSAHVTWKLSEGSFDLAFAAARGEKTDADLLAEGQEPAEPETGGITYDLREDGIQGSGEADFDLEAGTYDVSFIMHGAVGTAEVTSK